ncbi:predicted protein [Nematostella vectensis]|uniref:Uncharacterized protein n=1 Tax=Nematostella vectensis TaxID=45351 RepID=A7TC53_NEMVE|nr:predicted protein [Nematostella vectensis]|eukprot:XP_001618488.1 hypothetical protein NEMVEDRAFT_v1g225086 [Nematostella vectensis]
MGLKEILAAKKAAMGIESKAAEMSAPAETQAVKEESKKAEPSNVLSNMGLDPAPAVKEPPAPAKPMTFAEKMALKKAEAEAAKPAEEKTEEKPAVTLQERLLAAAKKTEPATLTPDQQAIANAQEDSEVAQAYTDIALKINNLSKTDTEEDLKNEMAELKKALHKNPSASLIMLDSDIGQMDKDKAIYECWKNYWPVVESESKTQFRAIACLMYAFMKLDALLMEYDVAEFRGKPAIELSFKLNINKFKYFVGHIDVVLKSKLTGQYMVMEVKHTALNLVDIAALYKNSGQALGYSIALDEIAGEEQTNYGVLYVVSQLGQNFKQETHILPFQKTLVDRLNWFVTLGLDVQRIEEMEKIGIFPKRGGSCVKYNKPCFHYGICDLHSADTVAPVKEDTIDYTFTYDLDTLIEHHLERIAG